MPRYYQSSMNPRGLYSPTDLYAYDGQRSPPGTSAPMARFITPQSRRKTGSRNVSNESAASYTEGLSPAELDALLSDFTAQQAAAPLPASSTSFDGFALPEVPLAWHDFLDSGKTWFEQPADSFNTSPSLTQSSYPSSTMPEYSPAEVGGQATPSWCMTDRSLSSESGWLEADSQALLNASGMEGAMFAPSWEVPTGFKPFDHLQGEEQELVLYSDPKQPTFPWTA